MLNLKKLLKKMLNETYTVENSGAVSLALPASDSGTASKDVSKEGWTPIGVVGVHTSGTGSSLGYLMSFRVYGDRVSATFRNTTTTARNYNVYFDVLYKRNV